jgi:hypothetical protein
MNRTRLPPGPTSVIPGRLLFKMIRNPLRFLESVARTYGDVAYFKLGFRSHCLLTQPGDIKDVMITRSGSFTVMLVCGDRAPAFEDYGRLPYAKAVLSEAMRLYPPAWHLSRRALGMPGFFRSPSDSIRAGSCRVPCPGRRSAISRLAGAPAAASGKGLRGCRVC